MLHLTYLERSIKAWELVTYLEKKVRRETSTDETYFLTIKVGGHMSYQVRFIHVTLPSWSNPNDVESVVLSYSDHPFVMGVSLSYCCLTAAKTIYSVDTWTSSKNKTTNSEDSALSETDVPRPVLLSFFYILSSVSFTFYLIHKLSFYEWVALNNLSSILYFFPFGVQQGPDEGPMLNSDISSFLFP